jgi:hypothetical protein
MVCLTLSGGLAALSTTDPAPHQVRTVATASALPVLEAGLRGPTANEVRRTFVVGEASTTTVAPTTTTEAPTTTEPPTTEAPTTAPPTTVRRTTTTQAAAAVAPGANGTGDLAACIRHYESTDGVDPNLYQFEGATWALAFDAAVAQGLIPKDTPYTSASGAQRWVQDAAFWAWVNLGYLRSAWAAQRGRCF